MLSSSLLNSLIRFKNQTVFAVQVQRLRDAKHYVKDYGGGTCGTGSLSSAFGFCPYLQNPSLLSKTYWRRMCHKPDHAGMLPSYFCSCLPLPLYSGGARWGLAKGPEPIWNTKLSSMPYIYLSPWFALCCSRSTNALQAIYEQAYNSGSCTDNMDNEQWSHMNT